MKSIFMPVPLLVLLLIAGSCLLGLAEVVYNRQPCYANDTCIQTKKPRKGCLAEGSFHPKRNHMACCTWYMYEKKYSGTATHCKLAVGDDQGKCYCLQPNGIKT